MSNGPQYFLDENAVPYPARPEEIHAVEEKCHIQFPEFLKRYYQIYDSMPIRECNYKFVGKEFCLVNLTTIGPGNLNIEKLLTNEYFHRMVPEGWIPVEIDICGDFFFYDPLTEAIFLIDGTSGAPVIAAFSLVEFFNYLDQSSPEPFPDEKEDQTGNEDSAKMTLVDNSKA